MESSTSRAKLEPRKAPYRARLAEGLSLGYYRSTKGEGKWVAMAYQPDAEVKEQRETLGAADDFREADGNGVLDWGQAQAKAAEWFAGLKVRKAHSEGASVLEAPYMVKEAWVDYLADAARRGVKGIKIMGQTADAHILPALGAVEVATLTRKRIEDWHLGLSLAPRRTNKKTKEGDEPEDPRELTTDELRARRDTANRILTNLKSALNFAADRGKTGDSSLPWRLVKPFKGTTSQRVRFLTVDEQQKLVRACTPEFQPLVMGALFTGGRYGELSAVRVRDFDPVHRTLFIQWGKGKGDAVSRYVALSAEAVTWFRGFTKGREADELMWSRKSVERTTRAEGMDDPDAWASYDQVHAMEKAVKAAGIDPVTFHELRHTYASGLLNAGCPMAFVAKQLGHKDTRMCERHYGHIAQKALAASIEKLSPVLGLLAPEAAPETPKVKVAKKSGGAR